MANPTTHHVIIDIATTTNSNSEASPSSVDVVSNQSSNSRLTRGDEVSLGRVSRTPLNSGFCVSLEFVFTFTQIIASVIVLRSSRNEHPHAPLFAWIVGYASGCVVSLPLLLWRYFSRGNSESRSSTTVDDPSGILLSNPTTIRGEDVVPVSSNQASSLFTNTRIKILVEYIKIVLDLFFASWFIVGNIWIFGGQSSANEAPNLYRLCVVFLTFSCIGYALPFILCLTICCCLPCIISTLGVNEDMAQTRGATSECIDALPTHKFKLKKSKSIDENTPAVIEGGVVSGGTEKERMISGEDAVCCICIANYENNDELRELPCSHLFHKDCVDKWLKINALCPLCKREVGRNETEPVIQENASQQRGESRIENSPANTPP
ncbi:E3 ubiquitin-protein ligase At1g12760-like [Vicia villosa]|uniref:E3 ubiquitin-protein ligase At1g12760-like n=1 Tax=Vicia villosa TaxID=3911 RepID=UPI00273AA06D|nr:E3 ubiquitin-protein ligase At1g12760-like [Vicia villosa]